MTSINKYVIVYPINVRGIIMERNECLTFVDLVELFLTKVDDKMSLEEKARMLEKFSHVNHCKRCSSLLSHASYLYDEIRFNNVSNPTLEFIKSFMEDYDESFERNKAKEEQCKCRGHRFDVWTYYEYNSTTEEGKREKEWFRNCNRCGLFEVTKEEPEELKNKKLIR